MKKDQDFFLCEHCKNLTGAIHNAGVEMMCCGEAMKKLEVNTSDGASEKHLPVVSVDSDHVNVKVGSVGHPMTDEHFIAWVYLLTEKGGQRKSLVTGGPAELDFVVVDDKPLAVYAYCNLHGLWKVEI